MTLSIGSVYTDTMTLLSALAGEDDKGTRLDRFLSERFDTLSRSRAKTLIKDGCAFELRAGARQLQNDPRTAVRTGTEYQLELPDPVPATPQPEAIALDILFEDEHLILVNKAAGMAVHPAPGSWQGGE